MSRTLTIITATKNCGVELFETANSILRQGHRNKIEWIVIDGGSGEYTQHLFNKLRHEIQVFVSEKDTGIYDAWNKGIAKASGEWIMFLGAGDQLVCYDLVEDIKKHVNRDDVKIMYGLVAKVNASGRIVDVENINYEFTPKKCFNPPHNQGVILKKDSVLDIGGFDVSYKICGDSKLVSKLLMANVPVFLNATISTMHIGGVSTNPRNLMVQMIEGYRYRLENGMQIGLHRELYKAIIAISKFGIHRINPMWFKLFSNLYRWLNGKPSIYED